MKKMGETVNSFKKQYKFKLCDLDVCIEDQPIVDTKTLQPMKCHYSEICPHRSQKPLKS